MIDNPIPWPNGNKVACALTFDMDTDSILHLGFREAAPSKVAMLSMMKYDEVAVPRILEMYRRCEIKQTFFYPAWCMERYPHLVDMMLKDGHEIAAHGYLHESPNKISPEEELYWLDRQINVIKKMTGQAPRGWRAPMYDFSQHSIDFLVEKGFTYDASLMGDDIPYVIKNDHGQLIELPSHWGMDDGPHYAHVPDAMYLMPIKSPDEAMNVFMSEFHAMHRNNGLWVSVWHPYISGRLARCERIEKMILDMQEAGGVWFATMEEIAAHVQKCIDDGSWTPRVDQLPYYDKPIPEIYEGPATKGPAAK
ncbi:polysaccharide deacetylase [Maricurvus nonylphenolicus]|uniref:polysaccharide deacetylase family protein n=1 Tax=Maricurvus nonylphenolicus TaxID=1008307 RepID=UPI0036F1F557